ncbi:MAG: hypothetical protein QXT27_00665 [Pyrobaculum sp.]
MLIRKKSLEEVLESNGGESIETPVGEQWRDCLIKALAEMPHDLAAKILSILPRDVVIKALEGKNDPYLKLALLLLESR